MLKNMDPPLGFGNKCPNRLAYKKLIRMNMPLDEEGKVNFTTTLFALIRENLNIKMRSGNHEFAYEMSIYLCDNKFYIYYNIYIFVFQPKKWTKQMGN